MIRAMLAAGAGGACWWWFPFPDPAADAVVGLIAVNSPVVHELLRAWHYAAPGVALIVCWSVVESMSRVWGAARRRGSSRGILPGWPTATSDGTPALVVGEVHHRVELREVAEPSWLVLPERGLYTGMLICGAIGSGKTSACMRPFARQLLGWRANDPDRRMAGLVLEVKGDFCHQVREILEDVGRGDDYIELGLGGQWQWNPLAVSWLDSYSLAYTVASLINQLFGKGKEPFWQQAYVNLVKWLIELHRLCPEQWVTLRDVYRCTLDSKRIDDLITRVEAEVETPQTVRVSRTAMVENAAALADWSWTPVGNEVRAEDSAELRERLSGLGVKFDVYMAAVLDAERKGRLDAVKLWYGSDWMQLDKKLRSTIVEGLSVFLSVFDLPEVAAVFCPEFRPADAEVAADGEVPDARAGVAAAEVAADDEPPDPHAGVAVSRQLPALDELIDAGKVVALNMPAGTNPALARAVGVMLKQSWLQTLLRRPEQMRRFPDRVYRPAMFLCDEYQAFATVGEDDPAGDEKAFALTRQCRLVPIVSTQSISSLRAVLGQGEGWRALLQTLRTRIFLSLSDDSSAQIASNLCGQVPRMKASYTVSEQTARASASLLSGSAGGGAGSVGASKAFSEHREPLFHPRDFTLLGNCQAIVQPYDGSRSLDATRCYLKPDFLPADRPYWRALAAGEL